MSDPIAFLKKDGPQGQLGQKMPRATRVKNKQPAPIQITAEQILREAKERQEAEIKPPRQKITDPEELAEYRLRKRKGYEDSIRKNRMAMNTWVKYAQWEESQRDFQRARSVYERAIDVDYRHVTLWLKYAEMEMKHRFINHARNVWDRAVSLLPRVDQLWYKYAHMEEMIGNVAGARQIFERWMEWQPDDNAWTSYVKLELRYNEVDRARAVFERYVQVHNTVKAWLKFGKFEERQMEKELARHVYERAVESLGDDCRDEELFVSFAKFEERAKEFERARMIYKFALDHIPKHLAPDLYKTYTQFEKMHGDRAGIEDVIVSKRRFQYEEEIKLNPQNYDVWFDYVRLEEASGTRERVREVYERAIANVPPPHEKRFWYRYIYLWINYALYEELEAQDVERAREVYKACIKIVPHKAFSFSKIWIMFAHFEVRQMDLEAARKIFGHAVGMAPKDKIFVAYIQLENALHNFDRCRKIYEKYLEWSPHNCKAWSSFADLETSLQEYDRARAIYELAISQPMLDMPELLWKAYIDSEIKLQEFDRTRELYERLLQRTKHVKVWISFAQFEVGPAESTARARNIFKRADQHFNNKDDMNEERVMLLEKWNEFEKEHGDAESQAAIARRMPTRIKKKRPILTEDGTPSGFEEYYDYIFPDEGAARPNLKILEMAHKWKRQKVDERANPAAAADMSGF